MREALIEAGASPETAGKAAEELAGHDREFGQLRQEMHEGFSDVKGEFVAVRAEMREIETGLRSDILGARAELKGDVALVQSDIKLLRWTAGTIAAGVAAIVRHDFLH